MEKTSEIVDRCLGVVCARSGSKRLPNKNMLEIKGKPLVWLAYDKLKKCGIKNTFILTDIEKLFGHEGVLSRPDHLNGDNVPLQTVVVWFLALPRNREFIQKDGYVVILMPSAPFITGDVIRRALKLAGSERFNIIRSYSPTVGEENGLYVVRVKYLLDNNFNYDVYTGSVLCPGYEIHTKEEYEKAKRLIEGQQCS